MAQANLNVLLLSLGIFVPFNDCTTTRGEYTFMCLFSTYRDILYINPGRIYMIPHRTEGMDWRLIQMQWELSGFISNILSAEKSLSRG